MGATCGVHGSANPGLAMVPQGFAQCPLQCPLHPPQTFCLRLHQRYLSSASAACRLERQTAPPAYELLLEPLRFTPPVSVSICHSQGAGWWVAGPRGLQEGHSWGVGGSCGTQDTQGDLLGETLLLRRQGMRGKGAKGGLAKVAPTASACLALVVQTLH